MLKNMLKKIHKTITLIADDVLLLLGVFFISFGVFAIYVPAGYITIGISFLSIAYMLAKRKEIS